MLCYVLVVLLGLVAGSFVNAWVWRRRQLEIKKQNRLSVVSGRSQCPDCGHQLSAKDLVPVISWLWLRGRCRYCKKPISRQYPIVELLTAAVFVLSYYYWPGGVETIGDWLSLSLWLLSLIGLVALAVYDSRWLILPNQIIYPTLFITIVGRLVTIYNNELRS